MYIHCSEADGTLAPSSSHCPPLLSLSPSSHCPPPPLTVPLLLSLSPSSSHCPPPLTVPLLLSLSPPPPPLTGPLLLSLSPPLSLSPSSHCPPPPLTFPLLLSLSPSSSHYKDKPFNFEEVPALHDSLMRFHFLDSEVLYDVSSQREPRK